MKPLDAHAHLDMDRYSSDRSEVLDECRSLLSGVINPGRGPESNRESMRLQEETDGFVKANLGLHPTATQDFDRVEEVKRQIEENSTFAVGEIGLDHHHVTEKDLRERQESVFREMVETAEKTGLPVVVHTRSAEERSIEILEAYDLTGVYLHCFNGRPGLAQRATENGWKIGVSTQVLYSDRVRNIVEEIGLENLVLETDSPFLYRGERNSPVNVLESAEVVSEILDIPETDVVEETAGNTRELFDLE